MDNLNIRVLPHVCGNEKCRRLILPPFKDLYEPKDTDSKIVELCGRCRINSYTHVLKTLKEYFQAVKDGQKDFEYRKNDRNFKKGDRLILKEWNKDKKIYTGREINAAIKYVLKDVMELGEYAILGMEVLPF